MVRHDAVHNLVALVELLGQFRTNGDMRALDLVVNGLADVVQETRALGKLHVGAQLGGHDARQVGHLDGVLKHVLAVAGAVFHAAQQANQFVVNAVQVGFEDGLFAGLADLVVDLLASLLDHFLDAGGMDAAVHDELFQRDAGHLAANRIEAGDNDRLGRIVDDQIDAGRGFQGADVAALAADDAALHVIVGQGHDRHGGLRHLIGGTLLNGHGDDVARLFVALFLGAAFDVAHHDGGVMIGVLLDAGHEDVARLFHGHVGDALQLALLLVVQLLGLGLQTLGFLILDVQVFLAHFQVVQLFVQHFLALLSAAFLLGHFAAAAHFLVQLGLEADNLFLGLENGFFLFLFSPVRRIRQERIGVFFRTPDLLFDHVLPVNKASHNARGQSNQDQDNCQNRWHG